MLIHRRLHQVVAVVAGLAHLLAPAAQVPGLRVLHAPVAHATLHLVPAGTLPGQLVALQICRPGGIAVAGRAALQGEAVVVGLAHVTAHARHAGPTEALAGVDVARAVDGADGVAVAGVAAHVGVDAEVAVLAAVAVVADHVGLAGALAGVAVADRQGLVLVQVGLDVETYTAKFLVTTYYG